jgi:N-acetyl-anhydromuramyl-L-alanine amidase AmpD
MDMAQKNLKPVARAATGLHRIHWHWTAGLHRPNDLERAHYHFMIDRDGRIHHGKHPPEANARIVGSAYAAHTASANTGAIGVALCGMAGARERPFSPGSHPITELQIDALVEFTAQLCQTYGIHVARRTVLSHAEVQPTLGIAQKAKWDIAWLPGMLAPGDPVQIGDELRLRVMEAMR